jgi:hypothetical protein
MKKDPFGFEKAIEIDHLTEEQLQMVNEIFKDFK